MSYPSVSQAAVLVRACGKGALMAKLDLKSAYCMVPVHSADQHLLGLQWQSTTYIDQALPFGLRSAPKIFTAVADALTWAMECRGITNLLHYLDDFFCAPASSSACGEVLRIALPLCKDLGFPVAPEKVEGPATSMVFLGIKIDSVKQELSLPEEKLLRLKDIIRQWLLKKSATKRELQSLLSHLNHAAAVVRPGRPFMRHIINIMKIPKRASHFVHLNQEVRADLAWWDAFIQHWNGTSFIPNMPQNTSMTSDASGTWGCGTFRNDTSDWFQVQWPSHYGEVCIAAKELVPIVIGAALWGRQWSGSKVLFLSDNQAVVEVLGSLASREPNICHLLKCLFFYEAQYNFEHACRHLAGSGNCAADALSRNKAAIYFSLYLQAPQVPSQVPASLVALLCNSSLSWTSETCRTLFNDTLKEVSLSHP